MSGPQKNIRIDFVSDVSCPWCAIGLAALETALDRLKGEINAELHFQPFELNPDMAPGGEALTEHLARKYGSDETRATRNREQVRQRGEEVGFEFKLDKRDRIYNTFDAHRLLHWAGIEGKQAALKHELFTAYFTDGENPSDHAVLARRAAKAGLDVERASQILATDEYSADVRERERYYLDHGIHAVPAVILNQRHLIEGGQPAEVFEAALRQLAQNAR